ncbi:hypothetical protein [Streptomyces xylophagus]|uniref:hypothetical protein n=1 Tax=Streptomyces xylophagus TaxID=285514 RepID=UPI00131DE4DD|nr:hypothetical protein [Streptomyces xylophagus]
MDLADGFWDGSGSALLGSLLSGTLAVGTFYATRWHERKSAREQLAFGAAEDLAAGLLEVHAAFNPQPWQPPRGDWSTLWQAADKFGDMCIVRFSGLSEPKLRMAVADTYNLVFEALGVMRKQASSDPGDVASVDTDAMVREMLDYIELVVGALINWRSGFKATRPDVPNASWRGLTDEPLPHFTHQDQRMRRRR